MEVKLQDVAAIAVVADDVDGISMGDGAAIGPGDGAPVAGRQGIDESFALCPIARGMGSGCTWGAADDETLVLCVVKKTGGSEGVGFSIVLGGLADGGLKDVVDAWQAVEGEWGAMEGS